RPEAFVPNCLKCGAVVETSGNCPRCSPTATRPPQVRPLMGGELKRSGRAVPVLSRSSQPRTPSPVTRPQDAGAIGVAPRSVLQSSISRPSSAKRVAPPMNEASPPVRVAPAPAVRVAAAAQTSVAPIPEPLPRVVPEPLPDPLDQDPAELLFRFPEPTVVETKPAVEVVRARPAGICRRLLAWLVDAFLVMT